MRFPVPKAIHLRSHSALPILEERDKNRRRAVRSSGYCTRQTLTKDDKSKQNITNLCRKCALDISCHDLSRQTQLGLMHSPGMDVNAILTELRRERDQLNETILAMERLAASSGRRRRGRPPAWLAAAKQGAGEQPARRKRGRPLGSGSKPKAE
jgi:hypothetical protein